MPSDSVLNQKQELIKKSQELAWLTHGITMIPRVQNYKQGNDAHNKEQPIELIQFDFAGAKLRDLFVEAIKKIDPKAITFNGKGVSNQPIIQVKPEFIDKLNLAEFGKALEAAKAPPVVVTAAAEKPQPVNVQQPSIAPLSKDELIKKAGELGSVTHGITVIPRVQNYKHGNEAHNKQQPIDVLQFEFANEKLRDLFAAAVKKIDPQAITYNGKGMSNQPIIQVKPEFINKLNLAEFETSFKAAKSSPATPPQGPPSATAVDTGHFNVLKSSLGCLKNDALKGKILADFKSSLAGKSLEDLDGVIKDFKKSEQYKVLATPGGSATQISSVQACEDIIKEAQSQAQPKNHASPN